MSDEMWQREGRGKDAEAGPFGGPLFPDDPADEAAGDGVERRDDTSERRLRFGPDDTGPLPHWTAPPTGEIPKMAPSAASDDESDDSDEVDVWSTFTTESPVWRDDDPATVTGVMQQIPNEFGAPTDTGAGYDDDRSEGYDRPTGSTSRRDPSAEYGAVRSSDRTGGYAVEPSGGLPRTRGRSTDGTGELDLPPRREPGRITIGTDPSGMQRGQPDPSRRRPPPSRGGRAAGPARKGAGQPRNMSNAVIVGAAIAAVFIVALMIRPVVVLGIIVVILALAAYEYFGKVTEKGYRPAVAPGLAACVCAPLAAYWQGDQTLPLVVAFAFMAGAIGFIGAHGVESGPLPNMAITTMGVVWIGLLGSYAALILRFSTGFGFSNDVGTDTLFMVALGVVANDIGALVVGSAVGKTPLRGWISPSKTIEGLIGGAAATFIALFIASRLKDDGQAWADIGDVMWLALVIAVLAPLGDLTESMFKRNLDIKDFGTIVQGHGGVLDRFDGFLFALPGAYYLTLVLAS